MRAGRRWRPDCRAERGDVEPAFLPSELVGLVDFTELLEPGLEHDVVDADVCLILVPELTERC